MPIILTQTDAAADDCTGAASEKKATAGGTAGVTQVTLTFSAGPSTRQVDFQSVNNEPNNADWEDGDWTTRFEITTANKNIDWTITRFKRIGPSTCDLLEQIQADHADITCSPAGVLSNVSTVNGWTAGAVTDEIVVIVNLSNATTMTQSLGFKPSQNIDTPLTQGAAGGDGTDFPWPQNYKPVQTPIAVIGY